MNTQNEKKKRSANFSQREVELLCNLVIKYAEVLESKQTDAHSWREKSNTWEKLTAEFNLQNKEAGNIRTMHNLKLKYEGVKKELRKKVAKNKQEMFKTGGGVADITPLTSYEESIYNLIALSINGLPSRYDDDNVFSTEEPSEEPKDALSQELHDDYTKNLTKPAQENIYIEIVDDSDLNELQVGEPLETPRKKRKINLPSCSQSNDNVRTPSPSPGPSFLRSEKIREEDKENSDVGKNPAFNRAKWNPQSLKELPSTVLNVKKKHLLTKLQAAEKVTVLAHSKEELIQVQTKYYQNEVDHQAKEHKLKLLKGEQDLKNAILDGEIKALEKEIKEETLKKIRNSNTFSM